MDAEKRTLHERLGSAGPHQDESTQRHTQNSRQISPYSSCILHGDYIRRREQSRPRLWLVACPLKDHCCYVAQLTLERKPVRQDQVRVFLLRLGSPSDTRSQGHLHKSGEEGGPYSILQTAAPPLPPMGQSLSKHRGTDLSSGTPLRPWSSCPRSSSPGPPGVGRPELSLVWEEHRHSRLISPEHRYKLPFENISKVNIVLQGTNNYL